MYAVVEFTDEQQVAVVPTTWLSSCKSYCKWPPGDPSKYIKTCTIAGDDWMDCPVRIFGTYETFELARAKLPLAEEHSDLASDSVATSQRCRKRNTRYDSSEISDDGSVSPVPQHLHVMPPKAPTFPSRATTKSQFITRINVPTQKVRRKVSGKETSKENCRPNKTEATYSLPNPQLCRKTGNLLMPVHSHLRDEVDCFTDMDTHLSNEPLTSRNSQEALTKERRVHILRTLNGNSQTDSERPSMSPSNRNQDSVMVAFQKSVLCYLEDLKRQVQRNTSLLNQLLSQESVQHDSLTSAFPLKSESDVQSLVDILQDQKDRSNIVKQLAYLGGDSVQDTTRRILRYMLDKDLALTFNWLGRNRKKPFKSSPLRELVIDAVRLNPTTRTATNNNIEKVIIRFLKYAGDLDGGRQERAIQSAEKKKSEAQKK